MKNCYTQKRTNSDWTMNEIKPRKLVKTKTVDEYGEVIIKRLRKQQNN